MFEDCRGLSELLWPSMLRVVDWAFPGTSIACINLVGTRAESFDHRRSESLEVLMPPRRCLLNGAAGLPALRGVTLGVCDGQGCWNPRQVRFGSLVAPAKGGQLRASTCVFAEVACVRDRELFPFPPLPGIALAACLGKARVAAPLTRGRPTLSEGCERRQPHGTRV
jgi:hypothetical protein